MIFYARQLCRVIQKCILGFVQPLRLRFKPKLLLFPLMCACTTTDWCRLFFFKCRSKHVTQRNYGGKSMILIFSNLIFHHGSKYNSCTIVGRTRVGCTRVGRPRVGRTRVGRTRVGRTRVGRTRVRRSNNID